MSRAFVALTTLVAISVGGACASASGTHPVGAGKSAARGATASSTGASTTTSVPSGVPRYRATKPVLDAADPVRLEIPAIGVSTNLVGLGLLADGSMEVPKQWDEAGWYTRGPRPGENGPAVIAGHVDSTSGPAVFFRLRDLRAGDHVLLTRADHSVVRFVIDRLQQFPKRTFPTAVVFAPTPGPALRLITCTGPFDVTARSYLDNLVAFASPAT